MALEEIQEDGGENVDFHRDQVENERHGGSTFHTREDGPGDESKRDWLNERHRSTSHTQNDDNKVELVDFMDVVDTMENDMAKSVANLDSLPGFSRIQNDKMICDNPKDAENPVIVVVDDDDDDFACCSQTTISYTGDSCAVMVIDSDSEDDWEVPYSTDELICMGDGNEGTVDSDNNCGFLSLFNIMDTWRNHHRRTAALDDQNGNHQFMTILSPYLLPDDVVEITDDDTNDCTADTSIEDHVYDIPDNYASVNTDASIGNHTCNMPDDNDNTDTSAGNQVCDITDDNSVNCSTSVGNHICDIPDDDNNVNTDASVGNHVCDVPDDNNVNTDTSTDDSIDNNNNHVCDITEDSDSSASVEVTGNASGTDPSSSSSSGPRKKKRKKHGNKPGKKSNLPPHILHRIIQRKRMEKERRRIEREDKIYSQVEKDENKDGVNNQEVQTEVFVKKEEDVKKEEKPEIMHPVEPSLATTEISAEDGRVTLGIQTVSVFRIAIKDEDLDWIKKES